MTQGTAAALLSRAFAYDADVLPLSYDGSVLTVAVAAESSALLEQLVAQTRKDVRTVVMPVREIREALRQLYPPAAAREGDSQAAHMLDEIFAAAISTYACDVHIEPTDERAGRVRLDVDGVLQHDRQLEAGLFERVVALLKVRSNMNTGESRLPQDGRLAINFDGRAFDVRASTIPVGGLEKIVLRFLQRFDLVPDLEQLGMSGEVLGRYQRALKRPGAFAVVAGPPGSGKTTTVAALVDRANKTSARHIVAYETPIEYVHVWQRSIVTQYEVGRDVSSFAEGVRGALRCDPNLVVIGEMKEADTAEAALAAAEAGHVVFATLHTPSETSYAVNRIVGLFPAGEHDRVRGRLAEVMHSIVALRLLPLRGGRGLRPATEILVVTDGVRRHLRDGSLHQIRSLLSSSRQDGSQTLERDLDDLVAGGYIEYADAFAAANYPSELAVPAALRPSRAW